VIPALRSLPLIVPMPTAFCVPLGHKVIFVGDPGVGKSSLAEVCMDKPVLDKRPPNVGRVIAFTHVVTGLEWERVPGLLETARTTVKQRRLKNIRQIQLRVLNIGPTVSINRTRPSYYSRTTAVVFCFSIGDEDSFENIKNKVN